LVSNTDPRHLDLVKSRYDKITIIEAPKAQAAFTSGLAMVLTGMGTLESLEAFTLEEMEKIISKLP
jgi:uncharacterized protein with GYD domain